MRASIEFDDKNQLTDCCWIAASIGAASSEKIRSGVFVCIAFLYTLFYVCVFAGLVFDIDYFTSNVCCFHEVFLLWGFEEGFNQFLIIF